MTDGTAVRSDGLRLCPNCGEANVDYTPVAGPSGDASCRACMWHGKAYQLVMVMGTEGAGLAAAHTVRLAFIRTVGTAFEAKFAEWAIQSGFLDPKSPTFQAEALLLLKAGINGAYFSILQQVVEMKDAEAAARAKAKESTQ